MIHEKPMCLIQPSPNHFIHVFILHIINTPIYKIYLIYCNTHIKYLQFWKIQLEP